MVYKVLLISHGTLPCQKGIITFYNVTLPCQKGIIRYYQFQCRNFIALVNYDTVVHVNSYLTCQKGIISFIVAFSLH